MSGPLPVPASALAFGAHPDDIEFGAGGTLAAWARRGSRVVMAIMTDGSKGSWHAETDPQELVGRRADEQRAAAEVLGAAHVEMLEYVDGELDNPIEMRARVARLIRIHRPEVVLSHDPWGLYEIHPDHRATGWAVVDGAVAARDHLFYPGEGPAHHRPDNLLLWRAGQPDHWEDISATLPVKIEALLCHESQHHTTMNDAGSGRPERAAFEERVRGWAAEQGQQEGLDYAEAFKRINL